MSSAKTDNPSRTHIAKVGNIPQTTLKIPMPTGAKAPPAAPSTKHSTNQRSK